MRKETYEIEKSTPFSKSLIWQLNRDYYNKVGIDAWREGIVPHHLTSSSIVGKTYAELVFGFLKDLSYKGHRDEKVYILELGAGHGRFSFHIIKHLERLTEQVGLKLPPYCYVISDIVEENLLFFLNHPQFKYFFDKGTLDVAHYDAMGKGPILLRHSLKKISLQELNQPLLVIANYFFDSIPKDLFLIRNNEIAECRVSLNSDTDPKEMEAAELFKNIKLKYSTRPIKNTFYEDPILNEILNDYIKLVSDTYLFFPHIGLKCIQHLKQFSKKGMMLISMDKGFHEVHDLENVKMPEMITHGSVSFYVNYHAFITYCKKNGGTSYFPTYSTFHLQLGCLLFLPESESYTETKAAYQRVVNEYGPDDFNGYKKFCYKNIAKMSFLDLIGLLRLSAYDSTLFVNILPRLKQVATRITFNDRTRLAQTMHQTWNMYFLLKDADDLAFEIGGLFYSLGYYEEALNYFQFSINQYGHSADGYYNRILCHYQLRQDESFVKILQEAKSTFPDYEKYAHLDTLDLNAV